MANVIEVIFQGVDQISQNTAKIDKSLSAINKTAVRAGAALAGAFAIGAVKNFIVDQVNAADAMLDLTKRIGGTVESLSELEHVAELSGVRFETMSRGLETMTRRIAEAAQGSGAAEAALAELGLDAERLLLVPLDRQFEAIAQALSLVETQSDKTRLATKLFEAQGIALLQTMEDGAAGIQAMRAEAVALGRTTTEQARSADAFNDSLARMNTAVDALARNMAFNLVPAINAVVTGWNRMLFNADPFPFEQQILNATERLSELRQQLRGSPLRFGDLMSQIAEAQAELDEALRKQQEWLNNLGMAPALPLAPIEIDSAGLLAKLNEALDEFQAQAADRAKDIADSLIREFEPIEDRIARELDEVDIAAHLIPDDLEARIRERIKAQRLEGLELVVIDTEATDRKLQELLDSTDDTFTTLDAMAEEAARSAQRAFSDFFFDIFDARTEGMVTSFLNAIRRILADKASIKFFELLFGGESGGGGLFGSIFKVIGSLFGGGAGGGTGPLGPPRAHGGFTVPGSLHPVNEREPEFLLTRGRSEVVPLSKMAASGAGGGSRVFSPTTNFNLMTAPLSRDELEEFSQGREDHMFARFKRMLRDDGVD